MPPFRTLALALLLLAMPAAALDLTSPDGKVAVHVDQDPARWLTYAVTYDGTPILAPSILGLDLAGQRQALAEGLTITGTATRSHDSLYRLVAGKVSTARDHFNEVTVSLMETAAPGRRLDVIIRAYDDGVALRYRVPAQAGMAELVIRQERTRFRFAGDYACWGLNLGHFRSSHEGEFDPVAASRIRPSHRYDAPLVCRTSPTGPAFAITEADLRDYAGLYLTRPGDGSLGVESVLSPRPDQPGIAVRRLLPADGAFSPWRVLMLARHPGALNESNLITTLNPDPAFADTGWIKPGKASWDWWNGWRAPDAQNKVQANDATVTAFIDQAASQGLDYMLVDDGWYLNSGGEGTVKDGADLMRVTPGLDLPAMIDHGRKKGIGLWLWMHWEVLEPRMEQVLAHYARMGIKGIKVDFMDRDDQWMVDFYHRLLSTAARHKLLVDLHGAYHPTGLIRTYPNYLTQEGVLGAEYNKWSSRITPSHNVMLAYTRLLLGPMDYTPGGFRHATPETFQARFTLPEVQTTRAHGLALFVVYDSPFTCVSDSPDAYEGQDGLDFIRAVPTVWDEVRFVAGEVGESIALARRKGDIWYVGVINNEQARDLDLPLSFLGRGSFTAEILSDGPGPAALSRGSRTVTAADHVQLALAGAGGAVLVLRPGT
ncbi:glycoside hydrolase family 97 protein [Niveispirillum sp.]|uniref:glycoside hydrolase family 97 protein n=1 Tax=Niveispirillum sp. TaxID=1917217 RepID=UPI001B4E336B|nr:glycoside hydrolase family 97 protein [Niveispirillum sp.]MBP7335100.1 glycoside hydrolase family 97 protein [Niveispirillum sp.]